MQANDVLRREVNVSEQADTPSAEPAPQVAQSGRAYQRPVLQRLGKWSVVTLQQSVPIIP
ncbi:hypothetical protein D3C83_200760 [compost metagenome]